MLYEAQLWTAGTVGRPAGMFRLDTHIQRNEKPATAARAQMKVSLEE